MIRALLLSVGSFYASTCLALPSEYGLDARQQTAKFYTVHPAITKSKCMGVLGGKVVVGAFVDIYDCNGSATQRWSWGPPTSDYAPSQIYVVDTSGKKLCMDIPPLSGFPDAEKDIVNGAKLVLKECKKPDDYAGMSFGRPIDLNANGMIQYSTWWVPDPEESLFGQKCVDLTDGSTANRNVLQLWDCNEDWRKPWKNQIWTITEV